MLASRTLEITNCETLIKMKNFIIFLTEFSIKIEFDGHSEIKDCIQLEYHEKTFQKNLKT